MVFSKWNAVIQVHGCYWHRHSGCPKTTMPSSNIEFWNKKFTANVKRDAKALVDLQALGWRTAIVWECAIRKIAHEKLIDEVAEFLCNRSVCHREFD